ncbi:MAG: alpha/beta fold hydrolase [Acidobacteriota bacterium]
MARSHEEELRRRRRKRLVQGVLLGGAAIGVPALVNTLIARRASRLPVPAWGRPQRFEWREGEIVYQRLGEGSPVLLLHSFGPGHDSGEWQLAGEILAEHHTVFAPDLLGWGRSAKPRLVYDGELYLALVADFLRDVVGQRAWIVAAGLPAAYAVQVGVDHPELLRGLGLVVPHGIELNGDEPDFKDAAVHRMLRLPIFGTSALNAYTSRSNLAQYLARDVYASPERVDSALVEHHYRSSHEPGSHAALAAYMAGYLNHNVEDALPRLQLPVWLAWGRLSASPSVEVADLWLHRLHSAVFEVFERAATLPHAEVPVAFSEKLEAFLKVTSE